MQEIINRGLIRRKVAERMGKTKTQSNQKPAFADKPIIATGTTSFKFADQYLLPDILTKDFQGSALEKAGTISSIVNMLDSYKSVALNDGFPANDLAYGFEFYIVNNYHLYHDVFSKPVYIQDTNTVDPAKTPNYIDMKTEQAIYKKYKENLSADPQVVKMTNAEK